MIVIYEYNGRSYHPAAMIDETTAEVGGSTEFARYLRNGFNQMRDDGYVPSDHMDKIRNRLYNNFRNAYYWAD